MKDFLKRLFGAAASPEDSPAELPASIERLQQMLEYARRRNLCSRGKGGFDRWIGQNINLVTEARTYKLRFGSPDLAEGTVRTEYPSVTWSDMPNHLGIYLVDGQIEFRSSHDGIGPREAMPLATDPADLAEIKCCFDYWYDEFDLPDSLDRPVKRPKKFEATGDALRDIQTYLKDGSTQAFFELFEDDGPVIWVDWREEDDNIVRMAADVLMLDDLTAHFDNDSCDLLIDYRGIEHRIRYPQEDVADRDTTIIALNRLLQPDHELRLCNASQGSDILALMALSADDWLLLERQHRTACAKHFAAIDEASEVFGRSG